MSETTNQRRIDHMLSLTAQAVRLDLRIVQQLFTDMPPRDEDDSLGMFDVAIRCIVYKFLTTSTNAERLSAVLCLRQCGDAVTRIARSCYTDPTRKTETAGDSIVLLSDYSYVSWPESDGFWDLAMARYVQKLPSKPVVVSTLFLGGVAARLLQKAIEGGVPWH